jgi:hypothetical protein|tara:strand:+ start:890 stop:1024 length:135 start_codon:yes stop_codon:yes gene_type:complete
MGSKRGAQRNLRLRGANYWKKWDLTLEETLKEVNLREEHGKAAV